MDGTKLQQLTNFLAEWLFNKTYELPIRINKRLKTTLAWYGSKSFIEVSQAALNQNIYIVADIIAHELLHWYLDMSDKPYDDKDIEFKSEAWRRGITETDTTRFDSRGKLLYEYTKHEYKCQCGNKIFTYEISHNINQISDITCCQCGISMKSSFIGREAREYIPSFNIKMAVDNFLDRPLPII